jgi:DNA-binding response OmpR family regulator
MDLSNTAAGSDSILVVEDDPELNSLVGAYVELCGYSYRPALNGLAALEQARASAPALVVLDLMLPDLDGFEVCKRLKSDSSTAKVNVIMLTAMGGDDSRQRGLASGAIDYLVKPFDPDILMASISRHAKGNSDSRP